jgi:hypothetical protein
LFHRRHGGESVGDRVNPFAMNEGPAQIAYLLASAEARDMEERLRAASERIAAKVEPIMRELIEKTQKALQEAKGSRVVYAINACERDCSKPGDPPWCMCASVGRVRL